MGLRDLFRIRESTPAEKAQENALAYGMVGGAMGASVASAAH